MAKGLRDIKRQIKSKQGMRQITKAMEMVAASKLRKAQMAAEAARPYTEKMREVVAGIAASSKEMMQDLNHPMLVAREVKRTGYLVITSDRGLAGGYNANVLRKVMTTIESRHRSTDEYTVFVIGRKGRDFFRKRNIPLADEVTGLPDDPRFSDIKEIASLAVQYYAEEKYDELYIVYNEFHNAISQTPVEKKLLPLTDLDLGGDTVSTDYEYEPSAAEVLNELLPKYAETLIYSALLEGKASEFGARMTAMGNATKNAEKMIGTLTLAYNRARQAAITQEISEIVAGANAQS